MGRFLSGALFFSWLAAVFFFFPPPLSAQVSGDLPLPGDRIFETEGHGLMVRSEPPGAKVFIDGIERGKTPLHLESLWEGRYYVQVQKEGYTERRFRVSVRRGSLLDISVELKEAVGRVLLKIRPRSGDPAAARLLLEPEIFIDGEVFQKTPYGQTAGDYIAAELPVGFRTFQIRAFGWESLSQTVYVYENSFRELEFNLVPASFRLLNAGLNRRSFNPANAGSLGTTTFNFEVSAPGRGTFTVLDPDGKTVLTRPLGLFQTWSQSAAWNGRNLSGEILYDGVYTLVVKAQPVPQDDSLPSEESLVLEVKLDSTRIIQPLTISSGKGGLLFAAVPSLLPLASFQIEGSFLTGYPPESEAPWKSLPFAVDLRFSPHENLEVSAALNVIPVFGKDTKAGAAGGLKWVFVNSAIELFGAAAGAVVSWTGKTGLTPFGMASGIELYFPFSVDLGRLFSFILVPAALWTADEGFPWEPIPRLTISGGLMMQAAYVSAGLSLRSEFNFSSAAVPPSFAAAAEVKIFPPPSSFVLSVLGGFWKGGSKSGMGGFAGFGIGMIY